MVLRALGVRPRSVSCIDPFPRQLSPAYCLSDPCYLSFEAVCDAHAMYKSLGGHPGIGITTLPLSEDFETQTRDLTGSAKGTLLGAMYDSLSSTVTPFPGLGPCRQQPPMRKEGKATTGDDKVRSPPEAYSQASLLSSLGSGVDTTLTSYSEIYGVVYPQLEQHQRGVNFRTAARVDTEKEAQVSESFFIAYAHCLLVGTGTRSEKSTPLSLANHTTDVTVDENLRGKTRTMRKRGASYETALEVFNEGLRRFPKSTLLLYGSSVAMQVRMQLKDGASSLCFTRKRRAALAKTRSGSLGHSATYVYRPATYTGQNKTFQNTEAKKKRRQKTIDSPQRHFQHAPFIPIVGVGKRSAY